MKKAIWSILGVWAALVLFACTESSQEENRSGIKFLLTDMPGEYQEVNGDVGYCL